MDQSRPPCPVLSRDEAGIRIDGHRPLDFDRARGLASELVRLWQCRAKADGGTYHHLTGFLPGTVALDLAVRLFAESVEGVRASDPDPVQETLVPDPDGSNGEGHGIAERLHAPDLGGEGGGA